MRNLGRLVAGIIALAFVGAVAAGVAGLPDARRYLRLRRM